MDQEPVSGEINLPIVVYTFHKNFDVLKIFLGQCEKFFPNQRIIILSDEPYKSNYKNILYKDSDAHYLHWKDVSKEAGDYFIYCQEDFLLYDKVPIDAITKAFKTFKNNGWGYLRLIKSGYFNDANPREISDGIFEINSNDWRVNFAMQPTIWQKNDFYKVYEDSRIMKIFDEDHIRDSVKKFGLKGGYCYNGENKRGSNHWNSKIFPAISTAIVKGKWNISEYSDELFPMKEKYDINFNERGIR
jgi:hypothetical protein